MIAPIDSKPLERKATDVPWTQNVDGVERNRSNLAAGKLKQFVVEHPAVAVAACAVLGLVVGYLIKRR
jgi:ElaB/YqjD/DUF883 family membrane-anchored ribosome-binding protein